MAGASAGWCRAAAIVRMTPDPERFAALLAGYCLDVQAGQQVLVRSTTQAAPLLLALQREILEREAWPVLRASLPGQSEGYWAAARDVHLDSHAPAELADTEGSDCLLTIQAPENTSELAGVDPARLARAARTRAGIRGARDGAPLVRDRLADAAPARSRRGCRPATSPR